MRQRHKGMAALLCFFLANGSLLAGEEGRETLRLTQGLAAPQPELLKPGQCVRYQEGGAGFLGREPLFWLEGTVVAARHEQLLLKQCPAEWQAEKLPPSREAFLQREQQMPCLLQLEQQTGSTEMAWVKLRVARWETPWAKSWANKGRLYRGMYLDRELTTDLEVEINARQLSACRGA